MMKKGMKTTDGTIRRMVAEMKPDERWALINFAEQLDDPPTQSPTPGVRDFDVEINVTHRVMLTIPARTKVEATAIAEATFYPMSQPWQEVDGRTENVQCEESDLIGCDVVEVSDSSENLP